MEGEINGHESKSNLVSIDGRLLVKLKLPKFTEGTEEVDEMVVSPEGTEEVDEMVVSPKKKSHFCHECNKGFSSGKAFGGHLSSAHVQAKEYMKKPKYNKSTKFKRDGSSSDAYEAVCSICGKDFPSKKSLFGHMRCHPDREWRGMEPRKQQQEKITYLSRPLLTDDEEESKATRKEQEEKITRYLSTSLSIEDDDNMRCHPNREWRGTEPSKEQQEKITRCLSRSLSMETDSQAYYDVDETENLDDYFVDAEAYKTATLTTVEDLVDSTEYLRSWTVKAKRGREGVRKYLLDIEPLTDEEKQKIKDAVDQLISLGNGDSLHTNPKEEHKRDSSSTPRGQIKEDVNGASGSKRKRVDQVHLARDRRDFPVKKRRFSETPTDSEETLDGVLDKSKGKARPEFTDATSPNSQSRDIGLSTNYGKKEFFPELDKIRIEEQNHFLYDEYSKGNVVVKNKRRRRKATPMTSETEGEITPADQKLEGLLTEETPEKFKCSTCGKTFSTHQALGGHRSSHNKLKINVQNSFDGSSPFPVGDENHTNSVSQTLQTYEIGGADASKLVDNIHQCKICMKTFSTGQALGGHKRCHWTGLSSQVAASPEAKDTQASVRKVLKFDLNEPAEMEDAKNDSDCGKELN